MNTTPITGLFVLSMLAGAVVLGLVFAAAGIASHSCIRQNAARASSPRPVITHLRQSLACEPQISLERGQFVTVPWTGRLQVHLPVGVRLQILKATTEWVRILAVGMAEQG